MELINFIDTSDRDKLKIVSMFEEQGTEEISFEHLMMTFGFSRFKLNNYIKQLNEDLEKYGASLQIIYLPCTEVKVTGFTNEILRKLRLVYLKKSTLFAMFSELIVSKLSIKEFGKSRFFSRSKTYIIKKELEKILASVGLGISNKELSGSEEKIRKFAFEVYYYFFNGLEFPFSESVRKETSLVSRILMSEVKIESVPTRMTKLELFMSISILRIKNRHKVEESSVDLTKLRKDIFGEKLSFYKSVEENYLLSAQELHQEIDFLLVFLITEDVLLPDFFSLGIMNSQIQSLTSEMEKILITELPFSKELAEYEEESILLNVKVALFKLHFKIIYFSTTYFTSTSEQQLSFFMETYPRFHHLVEKFLDFLFSDKQLLHLHSKKVSLYYDYMLALISSVPMKYLKNKIYICVDFSKGEMYTNYIVNNLEFFGNLNIEVQRKLTNNTDIYLSDYFYSKALCRQVIWKNIPNGNDWRFLGEIVADVRKE
ncbi:helix-turn-helix domain-containing protein [Enterococcus rivorum]|uniref:Mga helix-turn-helix domain-containing protein n=1 Tax=Enterococcus rivorum TaxID=762845 RepID=A0A1E5L0S7_9ENTE|nr:helix-turn-helix domain-containing protein [Enterococcus rivorum]MBP2098478.1 hypothetical protein [Enterococcus rivorum]OEH83671.1 hypothetical protein BCR26_08365 [Enterococcus rivorum]